MLAIVIPYYKFSFFDATLQSLIDQTDKRFKVYIGDDASSEDPTIILEKYRNKLDFFYHRFDENLGGSSLTKQWNRCVSLTNDEEWIIILGDDDVLGRNVVEEFYNNLLEIDTKNINVIRFASQLIDENDNYISEITTHPILEIASTFLVRKIKGLTRSSLSEYVFKKENVLGIGFNNFPLAWHSDDLAVFEFSLGTNIFTINNAQLMIRISNESISGNVQNKNLKDDAKFSYYWILLTKYVNFFEIEHQRILKTKMINSFLNKKSFHNYLKIIKYFILRQDFKFLFYFNIRLIMIIKSKTKW